MAVLGVGYTAHNPCTEVLNAPRRPPGRVFFNFAYPVDLN